MKRWPFAVLALLPWFLDGCAVLPSYQLRSSSPHKDVLELTVYLPERADSGVYRRIALLELERIRAEDQYRLLPLYEVSFEFRRSGPERERMARVLVHLSGADLAAADGAAAPLPSMETTLY